MQCYFANVREWAGLDKGIQAYLRGEQEQAREQRDQVAKLMTPTQIEKGQELSRDYFDRYVLPFQAAEPSF